MDIFRTHFTGYERDGETGLDFAQARMYGQSHGRFTSPDPYNIVLEKLAARDRREEIDYLNQFLMVPQNWNKYVYVLNNPLNLTDPTGLIYVSANGYIYYIDDKDFDAEAVEKQIGKFEVVPNGTAIFVGGNSTGIFEPYVGKYVYLLAGGKLEELPTIGNFMVESERDIEKRVAAEPSPLGVFDTPDDFNAVYYELELAIPPSGNPPRVSCFYRACGPQVNNVNPTNGCFFNTLDDFAGDTTIGGACAPGARTVYFRPKWLRWLPPSMSCHTVRMPPTMDLHNPLPFSPCAWPNNPF